jgi:hypothetical protein
LAVKALTQRAQRHREASRGDENPMMLLLSIVLGILPLLGIGWTVMNGTVTTVDGLFLSLILLSLSAILFLNAYLELRKRLSKESSPIPEERK